MSLIPQSDCHAYIHPVCYDIVTSKVYYSNPDKPILDHVVNLSKIRMKLQIETLF